MAQYTLIAVGKLKESYFKDACGEYIKRLSSYGGLDMIELPEQRLSQEPSQAEIMAALSKEAAAITEKIPKGAFICALCVEGRLLDSRELSRAITAARISGKSRACFIIGSSYGLDETIKSQANLRLSMSKMTFPHHLARVMLLEQLYRAEKIAEGSGYHK